jgi:hypothetical protein
MKQLLNKKFKKCVGSHELFALLEKTLRIILSYPPFQLDGGKLKMRKRIEVWTEKITKKKVF